MNRDLAILWVHETVGTHLDGEATLAQCLEWIINHGHVSDRGVARFLQFTMLDHTRGNYAEDS